MEASLNQIAATATAHCLTGCAIGEIFGLAIGTALGWGNAETIALAVGLAFLFGYGLTSLPLLRSGMTLGAVIPVALAADTFAVAVAFVAAFPVNQRLISAGRGHAVVHAHHAH